MSDDQRTPATAPDAQPPQRHEHATSPAAATLAEEIGLADYLRALMRYRQLVIAGVLTGAIGGFAMASVRPVLYEAVTTLMVLPSAREESSASTASYRALLENLTLASEIVQELRLDHGPRPLRPREFLDRALTVDAGGQESRYPLVLRLRVQLEDPQQALEAARGLANKAVALNTRIALQDGLARRGELKAHLDAAGHRLQLAEEELLTFQRQNQLELLQRDTEALLDERQALLRLIVDIEGEKARLATAEEELRKHQPMLPVARAVAAEEALRRSMAKDDDETPPAPLDLSHPYANPVYQTLEFQIATSRAHLASLEAQRRELMEVRKLGGATLEQLTSQHEHEVEEARRRGAYDLALRVHDDLALRFEQAHTQVLGTGVQLQVIDEGTIPTEPLPRGRLRWMLLGIALGMLSGSLGALVLDAARA